MGDKPIQRRLAAVLAADVAGYTRLMELDSDGTVAAWQAARDGVIDPTVAAHSGRLVKLTGDGFLVEFPTVQDAVKCAIAMQIALASSTLDFRMGVNLGDIIDDGRDIHGEGVNVAARLEAIATPGSICISGDVYNQVRNRIDAAYEDLGEKQVKNVSAPVRAYAIAIGAEKPAPAPAETALELPDKPSIAVLPFTNMMGDPAQEFFADGMTEDLITDLSKVAGLFVVARNSTFVYKGKQVDIRAVARDLGVRYVLEGSVRKSGERVRINAQLIDATDGGHLWAERYDGTVADVFELQDEVGAKVVEALSVKLSRGEERSLNRVHTHNLDAYELFVRAKATPYPPVPKRIEMARGMFERVMEMDPEFAGGYAGVSWMLGITALWAHGDVTETVERAVALAHKAIEVDETFGWSYTALGVALLGQHRHEEAIAAARDAVERQPNDADGHAFLGLILVFAGQTAEAIEAIEQALRLNPQFIGGPYYNMLGQAHMMAGNYQDSLRWHERNMDRGGPFGPPAYCWLSASYQALGRQDDAREVSAALVRNFPEFKLTTYNFLSSIREPEMRDRAYALMRDAGIPE